MLESFGSQGMSSPGSAKRNGLLVFWATKFLSSFVGAVRISRFSSMNWWVMMVGFSFTVFVSSSTFIKEILRAGLSWCIFMMRCAPMRAAFVMSLAWMESSFG